MAAQAQPPGEAAPIRIERVAEPVGAPTGAPFAPAGATPIANEPAGRPGPATGGANRPDPPMRDPATYNAVESSAQAARRLAESARQNDPSSPAFTTNGGNDTRD